MHGTEGVCPICDAVLPPNGIEMDDLFDRAVRFIAEAIEDPGDEPRSSSAHVLVHGGERRSRLQNWRARRRQIAASSVGT